VAEVTRRVDETAIEKMKHNYLQCQEEYEKLKKRVNLDVNTLVTEAEKDMENLISRKCLMEQDKINIETTIAILEKLKIVHLEKAFKIVNIHMAGIFSKLMNGTAEARLEKINKTTIFEGFELKVKFSNG